MTQHWYPFYWSDYSGDTFDLSQGQHGAYILLLRFIYTSGKRISHDHCYSIARAVSEQEKANVDEVLRRYFKRDGDEWYHSRCDEVMGKADEAHQKRVNAGKQGGKAKAERSSNAKAMPEQSSSNHNHNYIDNTNVLSPPISPKTSPDAFGQFWELYPRQRRGSKDKALLAYKAALKRNNTEQQIIDGVKTYATSSDVTRGYAKGCTAWLNDDGFLNDHSVKVGNASGGHAGGNRGFGALATAAREISEDVEEQELDRLKHTNPDLYLQRRYGLPGGGNHLEGGTPAAITHQPDAAPAGTGSDQEN